MIQSDLEKDEVDVEQNEKKQTKAREKQWVLAPPTADDGEVFKLDINESIKGELIDKYASTKYKGRMIYKLQTKNDTIPKVIVGTTMLDEWMRDKEIGEEIKIKRLADSPLGDKPNPMQNYEVYRTKWSL